MSGSNLLARVLLLSVTVAAFTPSPGYGAEPNVVLQWNTAALEAVRRSTLPPPAVARALAIVHTCVYDAWAVYDPAAMGVHYRGPS